VNSAIYEGTVHHRRSEPVEHDFRYRIGMLYVDLDELPAALDVAPLWSARRRAPAGLRREDFLGDPRLSLGEEVRDLVGRELGERPQGAVRLLTMPRTFGRSFNPVSFYFCFDEAADDADDEAVTAIVAEVTNTPWGERHAYVMDARGGDGVLRDDVDKAFHVSPFMGMDHRYRWAVTVPGEALSVHIGSERAGRPAFEATLSLRRRPLTAVNLNRLLARFPFAALRVLALIYGQALRLRLKGATYFPKPSST
jgi:DUF1365 family protein